MKKITVLIISMLLLLSGCSSNVTGTEKEITVPFSFGDRTGTYAGDCDDKGLPDGFGVFSSQRPDGTTWTYSGQWEHGHWNGKGTTVWSDGQIYSGQYTGDFVSGYGTFYLPDGSYMIGNCDATGIAGMGMLVTANGETVIGNYADGVPTGWCAMYLVGDYEGYVFWGNFEDGEASGVCYTPDGDMMNAEYRDDRLSISGEYRTDEPAEPETVPTEPEQAESMISSDKIETAQEYLSRCQYFELADFLSDGDADSLPDEIAELCTSLSELTKKCDITIDTVENVTTVQYKSVNKIDSNTCVIPTVTISEGTASIEYQLGFTKQGWLFFDDIIVSSDNKESKSKSFDHFDIIRDTIRGGTVQEYVFDSYFDIADFAEDSNVTIRFKNEDERKTFDHTLSSNEINAALTLEQVQKLHNELYRLI